MTRAIFLSGGRGRAMLRYVLGRREERRRKIKTRGTTALMGQLSKEVGVQTEASKATLGGCLGLDGDMLVLRQPASRRCRRAIVDADAGCKMLSPGDGGVSMHEADGCAPLYSSSDRRRRDRGSGFVEMKLVVSSLRGRRKQY